MNNVNANRTLHYIDIPLQISYKLLSGKKLTIVGNAGLTASILIGRKEDKLLKQNFNESALNKSFYVSYFVGGGLIYNISDNYNISFDLLYRSNPKYDVNFYIVKLGIIKTFK